jgi:hypothetical protein
MLIRALAQIPLFLVLSLLLRIGTVQHLTTEWEKKEFRGYGIGEFISRWSRTSSETFSSSSSSSSSSVLLLLRFPFDRYSPFLVFFPFCSLAN